MAIDKNELLKLLSDVDVAKAIQKSGGDDLQDLIKEVEITDTDTLESLSKKQQAQLQKLVVYFNKRLSETEKSAISEATKSTREEEARKIRDFEKAHPAMKKAELIEVMQPLYDKGMSLEDSYEKACLALKLDPTTGEVPVVKETDAKNKNKGKESTQKVEEKPKKEETKVMTSARSEIIGDDDSGEADVKPDSKAESLSLTEVISANLNNYIAKNGDPFK
jgi:hypothetical protein